MGEDFNLDLCHKCTLKDRPSVFGIAGSEHDIVLIGEAPGYDEVREGVPFIGRAGQLLNRIMSELGVDRSTVSISNSCLCHPIDVNGKNRRPTELEIECCNARLLHSIDLIGPKVIISLGAAAFYSLVPSRIPLDGVKMAEIVGLFHTSKNNYVLMATYHPAYALRNPEYEKVIKKHFSEAIEYAKGAE